MGDGFSRGPYRPNLAAGNMAVVAPEPSAPSPAAVAAAEEMMRIPNALAAAVKTAEELSKQMSVLCGQMELVAHLITERQRTTSDPSARNYFLNEAHTTHVSKAQIRRERREAKAKREAESKPARLRRKTRKSGSSRSRSR